MNSNLPDQAHRTNRTPCNRKHSLEWTYLIWCCDWAELDHRHIRCISAVTLPALPSNTSLFGSKGPVFSVSLVLSPPVVSVLSEPAWDGVSIFPNKRKISTMRPGLDSQQKTNRRIISCRKKLWLYTASQTFLFSTDIKTNREQNITSSENHFYSAGFFPFAISWTCLLWRGVS